VAAPGGERGFIVSTAIHTLVSFVLKSALYVLTSIVDKDESFISIFGSNKSPSTRQIFFVSEIKRDITRPIPIPYHVVR